MGHVSRINEMPDEFLKDLSNRMALNEVEKMGLENNYLLNKRINESMGYSEASVWTSDNAKRSTYLKGLANKDSMGYTMSLEFNEHLFSNGYRFNAYELGPDCASVAAENLLNQYDLTYPKPWDTKDTPGAKHLEFEYHASEKVQISHGEFLAILEAKVAEGKINKEQYDRLVLASEYFRNYALLLSKYFGPKKTETLQAS